MPTESKGLIESLSVLASTLVGVAHTRLELLSTDLEEDRQHLLLLVGLYLAVAFCLALGLVLVAILLVVAFWETHRLVALGSLAGFFITVGLVIWGFAKYKAKTKPKLFLATLLELLKDKQSLDSR